PRSASESAGLAGRQYRSAGQGAGDRSCDRPPDGGAARPDDKRYRQHLVRRVRPASGLDHLQRLEPVPRGDGGGAAIWQSPEVLNDIYVSTSGGNIGGTQGTQSLTTGTSAKLAGAGAVRNRAANSIAVSGHGSASTGAAVSTVAEQMVPLAAFSHFGPGNTPLSVNHHGLFVASTVSFNLPPGKSLSDAVAAIDQTMNEIGVPASIHGSFQGTAAAFQASLANEPILILAALITVYIVLGVLYE